MEVESSMGSTLHHLQHWCNELIQQAMGEFREEQSRAMDQQCESLQAEQQRLARKHSEITVLADRLIAQRQSSDDHFTSRAASLERRACDLDAFLDELAREQTNQGRGVQELRADVARLQGLSVQFDVLKTELLSKVSTNVSQLQQDIHLELQGMGQRIETRFLEFSQRIEGQERAISACTDTCRTEIERQQWQLHASLETTKQQMGEVQGQVTAQLREYHQDCERHLQRYSDAQGYVSAQLQSQQQETTLHFQNFSNMLERVFHCCMAFQDALGKDREKAEAALNQLVAAMDSIRQYTGKYSQTFVKTPSTTATTFVQTPSESFSSQFLAPSTPAAASPAQLVAPSIQAAAPSTLFVAPTTEAAAPSYSFKGSSYRSSLDSGVDRLSMLNADASHGGTEVGSLGGLSSRLDPVGSGTVRVIRQEPLVVASETAAGQKMEDAVYSRWRPAVV